MNFSQIATNPVASVWGVMLTDTRVHDDTAETPRETGARNPRGGATACLGVPKGVCPFVGILQGGRPPCKSGRSRVSGLSPRERGLREQYGVRLNGAPTRLLADFFSILLEHVLHMRRGGRLFVAIDSNMRGN